MCIFISMSSANAAAVWTIFRFIRSTCVWKLTFHRPCGSEAHLHRAQARRINIVNVQVDVHLLSGTSEKNLYNVFCPSLPGELLWFKECSAINGHVDNSGVRREYVCISFSLFLSRQNVIARILCSEKAITIYLLLFHTICVLLSFGSYSLCSTAITW